MAMAKPSSAIHSMDRSLKSTSGSGSGSGSGSSRGYTALNALMSFSLKPLQPSGSDSLTMMDAGSYSAVPSM